MFQSHCTHRSEPCSSYTFGSNAFKTHRRNRWSERCSSYAAREDALIQIQQQSFDAPTSLSSIDWDPARPTWSVEVTEDSNPPAPPPPFRTLLVLCGRRQCPNIGIARRLEPCSSYLVGRDDLLVLHGRRRCFQHHRCRRPESYSAHTTGVHFAAFRIPLHSAIFRDICSCALRFNIRAFRLF